MKTLFILNDPPYGTERSYNGLRLAGNLAKRDGEEIKVFFLGDAAACAKSGQTTPNGYYNIERMIKAVSTRGGELGVCGTCMNARGMTEDELVTGARRSTLDELTDWTQWADSVITF